jgi:dimeric dUTPase (all-alpha-NTP-PPase superfamily)
MMNLQKLFELQRKLDEHIEQEHPRQEGEDRLAKKILALQVEIGELLNELPEVFKFWSNKKNNRAKALEEYCDGLHFILSIGLELYDEEDIEMIAADLQLYRRVNIIEQFQGIFYNISRLRSGGYTYLFEHFLGLGKMLGFTWEEIEEAYMKKNAENHTRQENRY